MAEGSAVWVAEQELRLAQLQEEYHAALDVTHEAPDDADARMHKQELANQIVAVRSELRRYREADAARWKWQKEMAWHVLRPSRQRQG